MSLMDRIQSGMSDQQSTSLVGAKKQAEDVLRQRSGKSVASSGPRKGGMQERVQAAQAATAVEQQKQQGKLAAEQLKSQEEQLVKSFNQQQQEAFMKMNQAQTQLNQQLTGLLAGAARSNRELDMRKDAAKLEQASHIIRLSNEKYVQDLKQVAAERRLADNLEFKEETSRVVLGDNLKANMDQLGWQGLQNRTRRERELELAKMDISQAYSLSRSALRDYSNQQMWEGAGGMVKAGANMYAAGSKAPTKPQPTPQPQPFGPQQAPLDLDPGFTDLPAQGAAIK